MYWCYGFMRNPNYQEEIRESVEELVALERQQSGSTARDRIRFIRYLKEGRSLTQKAAGERIGLKIAQSQVIWRKYRQGSIPGLVQRPEHHGWGKLDSHQLSLLQQRLRGNDIYTQSQIIHWLYDEFGVQYTQAGVSLLLKRLKIKLKTGRPVNVRKDEVGEEAFKKTLAS